MPFGPDPKVHVLTACTAKKLIQSDMGQIRMQAEKVREGLEALLRVENENDDEEKYVVSLREKYPNVLGRGDNSALNSAIQGDALEQDDDDDDDEDKDRLSEVTPELSEASQEDITTSESLLISHR